MRGDDWKSTRGANSPNVPSFHRFGMGEVVHGGRMVVVVVDDDDSRRDCGNTMVVGTCWRQR
jgi:hypothetical protein